MIRFTCPCGKSLTARDEYAGETTRCPGCDRELKIPAGENVQAGPAPRGAEEVRVQSRPDREEIAEENPKPTKTSGMAIASIILGLLAVVPCSIFTGLPAVIFGALSLGAIGQSHGRLKGKGLAVTGIVAGGVSVLLLPFIGMALLLPAVAKVREAAARINTMNNFKQMTLAMQSYNAAKGAMPP
jgi:uncharacterized membrane protein YjgN (DUF898 family)